MRDRERFEHHPARLVLALNSKNSRDLPAPASAIAATICPRPACAEFDGVLHRFHLGVAADELRQSAPGRALQTRAQRPESVTS